jgi:hypothetical protein
MLGTDLSHLSDLGLWSVVVAAPTLRMQDREGTDGSPRGISANPSLSDSGLVEDLPIRNRPGGSFAAGQMGPRLASADRQFWRGRCSSGRLEDP